MKVVCEVCGNTINTNKNKPKERLTLRLSVEELEFLDKHAGWGKRATLCKYLLREYISREEEFVEIISKQMEITKEAITS